MRLQTRTVYAARRPLLGICQADPVLTIALSFRSARQRLLRRVASSRLHDGDYTLDVCATQAGSGGNSDKTVCKTQAIVVACAQADVNPCASEAPFGEVVGNTQIKPHATAQIQFRGNFGSSAWVEIRAEGFYRSASIGRNGESCTYHANWKFNNESGADFIGNAGAGVYTVKVSGNANTLEFPVTLSD
jgi:hypothetical protein